MVVHQHAAATRGANRHAFFEGGENLALLLPRSGPTVLLEGNAAESAAHYGVVHQDGGRALSDAGLGLAKVDETSVKVPTFPALRIPVRQRCGRAPGSSRLAHPIRGIYSPLPRRTLAPPGVRPNTNP